ncbi:hypothetical protein QM716_13385 [Rhodococcus sp. IEGM 1409]|uniref:hypothetical protein n=1 Tax=Rhodococcus sp. IEGM 1409 TaxID=3047082 RepID=UPI0024B74E5F|nr:hypothetical protein [Rhodococcus sp. IEGM 1409]MDI9900844.1 hypothetical protein [Rhodococcus sp. IEGM 1409]
MENEQVIIAVEGPSAAGKTTWCRAQLGGETAMEGFVAEYQPTGREPDGTNFEVQARYWATVNSIRWSEAEELASRTGIALCDSDPLKLHYSWCLAAVGAAPRERFEHELLAVESAFAQLTLGFTDLTVISIPSPEQLLLQREQDHSRRRRHFELHAALAEPLTHWYSAVDRVDPGRVVWHFPAQLDLSQCPPSRPHRSDLGLLRAVIDELPPLPR